MKNKITTIVLSNCLLIFFCLFNSIIYAQQKPNILFIITDDQRLQGTIHALDGNEVITPNIDAFVKTGTAFTVF